jgi:hypothetical protein
MAVIIALMTVFWRAAEAGCADGHAETFPYLAMSAA